MFAGFRFLKKEWSYDDMMKHDILDWSGIYKPWYKNGLYKSVWEVYDVLNLKCNTTISNQKNNRKNDK